MSGEATGNGAGVRFLDDVRVLEISNLAPNQLAMHLADLGAEVIKIEPPKRGDATRLIDLRGGGGDSFLHRRWNRGKRSVALDMRTPEGAELIRRIVPEVDIVIEGLRPGNLARMGFPWEELTRLKSNIVFIALSGFGLTGPYRDMPSHGMGFDAVTGLAIVEQDDQGRPVTPLDLHVNVGTSMGPLFGATAALAALSWARRTGEPVLLDLALADAAAFANLELEGYASERSVAESGTGATPSIITTQQADGPRTRSATLQYYRARDGKVLLLMPFERKFFVKLLEVIERPDLLQYFREDEYVARGTEEVYEALVEAFASRDRDEWMQLLGDADIPVMPVNEGADVLDDPHIRARIDWLSANLGTVTMKTPVRSQPATAAPSRAPALGEDTADVLSSIGVDAAELARLEEAGVVRIARPAEESDQSRA
jgi:crotonobetainyl-CoA:carnitine CoA-transferase CaiB-like acyl-CoA transferase